MSTPVISSVIGMLDLDAGVHLDEVELAILIEKLEGARAAIADPLAGVHAGLADAAALRRRDAGRGRFLDDFLMAALHGAVALAQMNGVAVGVGQHLDFDMAGMIQIFFHVHVGLPNAAFASLRVRSMVVNSAASLCTTRMPRPPPPPAALMMIG
jgi:hypothetical protein